MTDSTKRVHHAKYVVLIVSVLVLLCATNITTHYFERASITPTNDLVLSMVNDDPSAYADLAVVSDSRNYIVAARDIISAFIILGAICLLATFVVRDCNKSFKDSGGTSK